MKIVSLIPLRGGSKGIPLKPLVPLNGKPLMDYIINVSHTSAITETWVSTDHEKVKEHAIELGCKVLDRPAELATDTASTESVIDHFTKNVDYDIIVLLQATSPLLRAGMVSSAIYRFLSKMDTYDSVMSVYSTEKADMLIWDSYDMKPINYDYSHRGIRQERKDRFFIETGAFYITTRKQFLKSGKRVGKKIMFHKVPFWTSFEVDTMEDLINIERLLR